MTPLADTHAHLFDYDADTLAAIVSEAAAAGVSMTVNTAVSINTAKTVLGQCRLFPDTMRAAVGISPFDTVDAGDNWADELKALLAGPSASMIAAVGEIGLDSTNPKYPPLDVQMPFFIKQLEIAGGAGLPAVIHSRGAELRVAKICRDIGTSKAIFHCFTGDCEAMEYIAGCGYYISISGIVTYKNSSLRDVVKRVPLDRLLIETDAPYLSPVPCRGKPNKPPYLIHTAREIAEILGLDKCELSRILMENIRRALGRYF